MPTIKKEICIRIIDTLWSCFIVTPLVVFYWSGTWKLVDNYILPNESTNTPSLLSSYVSLGIGIGIGLSGYLILPILSEHINPQWSLKHVLVSRIFSYIYGFGILNFWRGVWNITDHYVGTELKWSVVCYVVSKLILIVLRSASTCLSSPFVITKDHRDDFYKAYTLCRSEPSALCRYLLDSLISHIGVVHISVQVWRALWNILSHLILPNSSQMHSYLVCLGAGYGFCLILFALQHPLYLLARRLRRKHRILEHILEVVVKVVATIACVLLWRGGWGLCRDYLLKHMWHFWMAHSFGMGLLLLLQSSGTIGVPSLAIDCEFGWGTGQYYPIDFFLHWYFRRRYTLSSAKIQRDDESENSGDGGADDDLLVG